MSAKTGTCIHFNGVQHDKCDAGICYEANCGKGFPCIKIDYRGQPAKGWADCCPKYLEPTAEQVAARRAEIDAAIEQMRKVGPLIRKVKTDHKGTNWRGLEVCPVCGGKLHMSHAAYNGHVHGQCETKDCVGWME